MTSGTTYCRRTHLAIMIAFALLMFFSPKTYAQDTAQAVVQDTVAEPDRLADDFVHVSLVIAEPGDVLYSILGHACLRMQCPYYGIDEIYSYESEQVRGRVLRFLLNDLKMGMFALPPDVYLEDYQAEGRGVKEYRLNLPPEVKSELWRVLDQKMEEGCDLAYDYIERGCAIAMLHCVNEAVKAANEEYLTDYKISYPDNVKANCRTLREIVYDNSPCGWQRFYGMTLVGGRVDDTDLPFAEKLIIPRDLVAAWQQSSIDGQAVIDSDGSELLPAVEHYDGDSFTPLHAALIVLVLAIVSLLWQKPYIDWLILGIQTLLGLLVMWLLVSPLPGSEWSWLIVVFNPLPAIGWHWRRYWVLPYTALIAAWCAGMLLAPHRLVEAAHIVLAVAFGITLIKQWMTEKKSQYKLNE